MKNLALDRPLIFLDLETTGIDPASDKIVEISVLGIHPEGTETTRTRLVNPGRPIPPQATAIHGIHDSDVADAPTFRQIARSLLDLFGDADLAGYNVLRFDLPLLEREFRDCELDLRLDQRRVLDAMVIFHRREPRHLAAALRFYLERELEGAHSAEADVKATAEILDAQLERYEDLPRKVQELDAWIRRVPRDAVDRSGKFVWQDGEAVFSFGKNQGKTLREVAEQSRGYLEWVLKSDFPEDARDVVQRALDGQFPTP